MIKETKKKFKQQKSINSELNFEEFCQKNDVIYKKMDDPRNQKSKRDFLREYDGKCPDYRCQKDGKEIFVEIKTLTNLTNQAREDSVDQRIKEIKAEGLSAGLTTELFNPIPEIEGPVRTMLKDASNKFKNLKNELRSSRILLLNGVSYDIGSTAHEIFLGDFHSYKRDGDRLVYVGFQKRKRGLFDETGSNVSAVIYWNNDLNRFEGIENPNAKISLSEDVFNIFFGVIKP